MDGYLRPAAHAQAEIEILKSRFIASAACVESVDAAKAFLRQVADSMPGASHHVYAYVVGHGASVIEGLSDAGEPSGTAGLPTMAVLRGSKLGDVMIVTTRYFGGTLLGTGGLVRAYTDAAKAVLTVLPTEAKIARVRLLITLAYPLYERTLRIARSHEAVVEEEDFGSDVTLLLLLPTSQEQALRAALIELSAGKVEIALM